MKTRLTTLLPLLCLLLFAACTPQSANTSSADPSTYFPIAIDGTTAHLQLALSRDEIVRGLMYRDALEPDHGMLFLFPGPGPRSFWMRNTRIPLDLAYVDPAGRILEIRPLYPFDETSVTSRSRNVLIAIEMNQGWFTRNGIRPGATIDLSALAEAVEARGESPEQFSLTLP